MKFQYVCKDVRLTQAMKDACEAKLSKFVRHFPSADAVCTMRITINKDVKTVEVSITSKGVAFRAKAKHLDFYAAVDLVIDKLEGQLRKVKTQVDKAHKAGFGSVSFEGVDKDYDALENLEIVKKKSLNLAPMDVDEALARMDALGHSFFVFLDSATGLVNVLYEREDHKYGLIVIEK